MTGIPSADDVPDADIDADLKTTVPGYDPNETYPEWGNSALHDAYRAGYEAALTAVRDAVGAGS